jgi:hypothetical protein
MLDRAACERRVYRLAVLLTGNPVAATVVIESVVGAQPDLGRLDSSHLDRLTVLRSREIVPGRIVDDRVPGTVAEALAALEPQQREAWVFTRAYGLPLREAAKAMDCSVTAARLHLDRATLGDDAAAVGALRAYALGLDVPAFHRRRQRHRRRVRRAVQWAAVVLAMLLILGGAALLATWVPHLLEGAAVEPGRPG